MYDVFDEIDLLQIFLELTKLMLEVEGDEKYLVEHEILDEQDEVEHEELIAVEHWMLHIIDDEVEGDEQILHAVLDENDIDE